MSETNLRLLVVSNRLPVVISQAEDGWSVESAAGGLVTALTPLMKRHRGLWIGWPGCGPEAPVTSLLREYSEDAQFDLKPVVLSQAEVDMYYRGFSNQTIWPLFHDLLGHCRFDAENWPAYVDVNRKFADVIAGSIRPGCFVWIHDYQLMLVGHFLREMGSDHRLNFFLHIPFPSRDLFRRLPWKQELIQALLEYDHIGFQTVNDYRNFIQSIRSLVPEASARSYRQQSRVRYGQREVRLGHYPISIDFHEFDSAARSPEVADAAWYLHENLRSKVLMLGLDRLDYTKGMLERLLAFERMLEKYPDAQGNISLVQIVVPSRVKVPDYQNLKQLLDEQVGRINSQFSRHGWVPIHYMYRHLEREQLLGHYRACEIALITPLRDGMNLVAKEYCASTVDDNGVLILSEFAGAAAQLARGALIVNPYDLESTADAIYAAYIMEPEERRRRMRTLRNEIKRNDVHRWVRWFLDDTPKAGDRKATSLAEHTTG